MKQTTITCDVCGTAKDAPVDQHLGSINARGWFTVSRTGYLLAADPIPPGSAELPRSPDLCSWACVATFAQKRAGGIPEASLPTTASPTI